MVMARVAIMRASKEQEIHRLIRDTIIEIGTLRIRMKGATQPHQNCHP